jgi:hypothetical protein
MVISDWGGSWQRPFMHEKDTAALFTLTCKSGERHSASVVHATGCAGFAALSCRSPAGVTCTAAMLRIRPHTRTKASVPSPNSHDTGVTVEFLGVRAQYEVEQDTSNVFPSVSLITVDTVVEEAELAAQPR